VLVRPQGRAGRRPWHSGEAGIRGHPARGRLVEGETRAKAPDALGFGRDAPEPRVTKAISPAARRSIGSGPVRTTGVVNDSWRSSVDDQAIPKRSMGTGRQEPGLSVSALRNSSWRVCRSPSCRYETRDRLVAYETRCGRTRLAPTVKDARTHPSQRNRHRAGAGDELRLAIEAKPQVTQGWPAGGGATWWKQGPALGAPAEPSSARRKNARRGACRNATSCPAQTGAARAA